jgi:hypothetical protein
MVENQDLYPYNRKSGGTCRNKTGKKKGGEGIQDRTKAEAELHSKLQVKAKCPPLLLLLPHPQNQNTKTVISKQQQQVSCPRTKQQQRYYTAAANRRKKKPAKQ